MESLPGYDAYKLATPPDPCEGCPDYDTCLREMADWDCRPDEDDWDE